MATPLYKKVFAAKDIATTTKGSWVTALTIQLSEFPGITNAMTLDAVIVLEILDVFVDTVGTPDDASGYHGATRHFACLARGGTSNTVCPFGSTEVVREGGFGNPDNGIRILPTSVTVQDSISVQVESPTGNNDGKHFVVVEATVYHAT